MVRRATVRAVDGLDALFGIDAAALALLIGVEISTARRWLRRRALPAPAARLLAIVRLGDLGVIDPSWRRWRLLEGELVSPEGWRARPGEVLALPFLRAQVAEAARRRRIDLQADWIAGEWVEPREESAALAETSVLGPRRRSA